MELLRDIKNVTFGVHESNKVPKLIIVRKSINNCQEIPMKINDYSFSFNVDLTKVMRPGQETDCPKITILGNGTDFNHALMKRGISFNSAQSLDDFYRLIRKNAKKMEYVLVNLEDFSMTSPFLAQNILLKSNPKVKFFYLVNNKEELVNALLQCDNVDMNFCTLEKKLESYLYFINFYS